MTAQLTPLHSDHVTVLGDTVLIVDLTETNADVVQLVSSSDDPAEAVHNCLRVGATALRVASTAIDVDMVQRTFDGLADRLGSQVTGAVEQIADAANGLLSAEDGDLHAAFGEFRGSLEQLLGSTFDPNSKASVVTTIETLVGDVVRRAVESVRDLVDSDGSDSPLAKLKGEILTGVKGEVDGVVREIRDVSEKLGIAVATAEVYERTSAKGFDFEDVVDERVAEYAAAHGDTHEEIGNEPGATGSKVGDEVVTLNREDTRGSAARFVLEVKTRQLGFRKILAELDEAMLNRDASAAIAVFDAQEKAPTAVPFHCVDDKAIVVLDADGSDDSALRLAYMWARWVVRRKLAGGNGDELDHECIQGLLEDARRAVERVTTIRRCHTTAKKQIDQAIGEVDELAREVRIALDELERQLSKSE